MDFFDDSCEVSISRTRRYKLGKSVPMAQRKHGSIARQIEGWQWVYC